MATCTYRDCQRTARKNHTTCDRHYSAGRSTKQKTHAPVNHRKKAVHREGTIGGPCHATTTRSASPTPGPARKNHTL